MTHQFKFGDMVRHKKYGIGVISYVKEGNIDFYVSFKDDSRFDAWINRESLELIPHPDTVRLDFIERAIPISGCLKREMNIGWQLQNEDDDPSAPKLLLRDAIDAAMQEQAAEAKEQP